MDLNNLVIRVAGIVNDSIVDGPGIRLTIFSQGCFRNCSDCHNPNTHDPTGGYEITVSEVASMIDSNPLLSGITFSGGEPFLQPLTLSLVAKMAHEKKLNVICYTGYLYEELLENPSHRTLVEACDYIIDGPYIKDLRNLELRYRGSSNQRIVDVKKSLESKSTILANI